ncbi:hypothetical protein MHL31_10325 [Lutibacter sp. A80]|nr:hypothetical protein [Lutibacter sp. A80]UMB59474.1 hypothetical protein MHL31_10325 [Lutibacter sp. A80]
MKEKKHLTNNVEDFINKVTLKLTKNHQQNNYPENIRGLFERLGIE